MDKFAARAVIAVFMGYSNVTKGYILFDLNKENVVFHKNSFPFKNDSKTNDIIVSDIFTYTNELAKLDTSLDYSTPITLSSKPTSILPEPVNLPSLCNNTIPNQLP